MDVSPHLLSTLLKILTCTVFLVACAGVPQGKESMGGSGADAQSAN